MKHYYDICKRKIIHEKKGDVIPAKVEIPPIKYVYITFTFLRKYKNKKSSLD